MIRAIVVSAAAMMIMMIALNPPSFAAESFRTQLFYLMKLTKFGSSDAAFDCSRGELFRSGRQFHPMSCKVYDRQNALASLKAFKELEATGEIKGPPATVDHARQFFLVRPNGRGAYGEQTPLETEDTACATLVAMRAGIQAAASEKDRREELCKEITIQAYRDQARCGEDTQLEALEKALR